LYEKVTKNKKYYLEIIEYLKRLFKYLIKFHNLTTMSQQKDEVILIY
jgi:hypothetical protein